MYPETADEVPPPVGSGGAEDGVDFVLLNDDVLTSVSNATMVLLDGSDLERVAVLYQFPQFLEHCPDETLSAMVPEIGQWAVSWSHDVQMAAAEALYFVVNMPVPTAVATTIVTAALRIIHESESGDVFDAWGEILSMMLPQVAAADVHALVVPATIERATARSSVESRRLAARIIGSLIDTLTPAQLEAQFLPHALTLCDDPDPSVRAMIAQSLAALGAVFPLHVAEKKLWPKLDDLIHDANPRVRAAAMRATARTAEAHRAACMTSRSFPDLLLPVFLRECATATATAAKDLRAVDDDTYLMLEIFAEVYGYFLVAVSPLFANEETWTAALNALRRMVTCNGPTVRHWCAFNVPAVSSVCAAARPEKIKGVIHALASDSDVETRATLAAGVHETVATLADGQLREEMLNAVATLISDQNPQVRMNALSHFSEILRLFTGSLPASSASADKAPPTSGTTDEKASSPNGKLAATAAASRQLGPIISSLETMSHDSWRTQKLLAEQLEASASLIPQDMLCEHVAPLLFQMARESTYLVRRASMQALIHVIRYIPDVRRRDHILKHFRSEWARGKV
jgi:HEAT repeat